MQGSASAAGNVGVTPDCCWCHAEFRLPSCCSLAAAARRVASRAGTAATPHLTCCWFPCLKVAALPLHGCRPQGFFKGWHCSYNAWLVRYMYVPLGGARWQLLNIWPIFFFVAVWHDLEVRSPGSLES